MELKIQRLPDETGRKTAMPRYQTQGAAAMDLAAFLTRDVVIAAGQRAKIPTGLAIELPCAYGALLLPRSSMGAHYGVCLANGVGLIDSDYRGEIAVVLQNNGDGDFTVHDGDRIAQLLIVPVVQACPTECERLTDTARGQGGFGSTGRK